MNATQNDSDGTLASSASDAGLTRGRFPVLVPPDADPVNIPYHCSSMGRVKYIAAVHVLALGAQCNKPHASVTITNMLKKDPVLEKVFYLVFCVGDEFFYVGLFC